MKTETSLCATVKSISSDTFQSPMALDQFTLEVSVLSSSAAPYLLHSLCKGKKMLQIIAVTLHFPVLTVHLQSHTMIFFLSTAITLTFYSAAIASCAHIDQWDLCMCVCAWERQTKSEAGSSWKYFGEKIIRKLIYFQKHWVCLTPKDRLQACWLPQEKYIDVLWLHCLNLWRKSWGTFSSHLKDSKV